MMSSDEIKIKINFITSKSSGALEVGNMNIDMPAYACDIMQKYGGEILIYETLSGSLLSNKILITQIVLGAYTKV